MCGRVYVIILIGISCWLCEMSFARTQVASPVPDTSTILAQDDVLSPERAAERKVAVQAQLDELERSAIPREARDAARMPLDDILNRLNALEEARQRSATFREQLSSLPKRLEKLTTAQKRLDARPPSQFPKVTEALRDQYNVQLHSIQAEIQELVKQNSTAEARLATIPQELEQRLTERPSLQQHLDEARRQLLQLKRPNSPVSEVSRLEVEFQLLITEVQALIIERQWLAKRGPLHDALLRAAQAKLSHIQQDLSTITNALGKTIEQEQKTLSKKVGELEEAAEMATGPVETLQLNVNVETARLRQTTADYRQTLNRLTKEVLAQEELTVQERQDADRIAVLFDKYAGGESGGELL